MFARFTPKAREAMALAQDEAGRLRFPWFGTEHLLLGLLSQTDSPTRAALERLGVTHEGVERELSREMGEPRADDALGEDEERALRTLGIDLNAVREKVEESFGPGALERARPGQCGVPMMPRLKQTIEVAAREAGDGSIETDHLVLGMIRVRGALAVCLLGALGATPERIRTSIQEGRARAS